MSSFREYSARYANISCERRDGVLLATLHTDGGPWIFDEQSHYDLSFFFRDVSGDPDNKVLILTGSGDRFCTGFDIASFLRRMKADPEAQRLRIVRDGVQLLMALADIDIPMIAVVNGPALVHAEIPMLADVVLAADTAIFQDSMHFAMGNVPGDGVNVVWTHLLGPNRGRYFLLTGQTLSAHEAANLGIVSEVLPVDELLARAWEVATAWARLPRPVLVSSRHAINYEWKRLLSQDLHRGFVEQNFAGILQPMPPVGDVSGIPPLELFPSFDRTVSHGHDSQT